MSSFRNEISEEEIPELTEQDLQTYRRGRAHYPVNVRTLHGVDLAKLKTVKYEGTAATPCQLHV
jgi:hypothetical protein